MFKNINYNNKIITRYVVYYVLNCIFEWITKFLVAQRQTLQTTTSERVVQSGEPVPRGQTSTFGCVLFVFLRAPAGPQRAQIQRNITFL